ncbi:MAG TPA: small, acid-soluble spore protein, alpha/beta type [Clostridia bacterium]|jgi:small acid-soluble spore protein F (minor alpha/beta-type SASP)|nr:small, acid-soluble spore protein, alpha/beta type [Clostridia bacterium]HHY06496.1 small, acid-soluble spore protein, alpha/beta type [Clostridia bacterium]
MKKSYKNCEVSIITREKKKDIRQNLLKIEIAQELGLWEKIQQDGWGELTAEESGRIGGLLRQRLKK